MLCIWEKQLLAFAIKNWNTKEGKGKSMMHVLHVLLLAKRHILGQNDVEQ